MSEPMYEIDFERVANQPVSEGIHGFVITDITEGESSNQNPMWTIRLTCLDEGPDQGKEATLWLPLMDSMRWKIEKFLDAVNAPITGTGVAKQFIGRKLKAQIKHRNNDGRMVADVGEMFPFSASSSKPAPVAKSATATPSQRTGAPVTAKVNRNKGLPAAEVGEDDLPF